MHSERRAALITGRNHHSVGFGVITEVSRVFRAMTPISVPENVTVGRVLSEHGYATSWFGKNHNTLATQFGVSGPFGQWPSGMGFDYFYGFMGGETDQWFPYLFRDHTQIFPWIDKPGYNLTTDLADEAIGYLDGVRAAAPDQPFFSTTRPAAATRRTSRRPSGSRNSRASSRMCHRPNPCQQIRPQSTVSRSLDVAAT